LTQNKSLLKLGLESNWDISWAQAGTQT